MSSDGEDAKASQVSPVKKKRVRYVHDIEATEFKVTIPPGTLSEKVVVKVKRSKKNGSHRASIEVVGAEATIKKIERK